MQLGQLQRFGRQEFVGRLIHIRSFVVAVLYGLALWFFVQEILLTITPSFKNDVIFLALMTVALIYMCWVIGRRLLYAPSIMTLALATCGILYFIDPMIARLMIVMASAGALYLGLLGMVRLRINAADMTAKSFVSIVLIAGLFLFYSVGYGIYINYSVPLWVFLLISYIWVFLLTLCSLRVYSTDIRRIIFFSGCLGVATLQLMWMANFWPFSYFTMAAASLMFYYVLWDLFQSALAEELSKRSTIKHIMIATVLLLIILLSSRWEIIA